MNEITETKTLKKSKKNLIEYVESKYLENNNLKIKKNYPIEIGNLIRIEYLIPEGEKERIQSYEGLVIAKKNRGLGKSFMIRRNVQGIGIEQMFLVNSPKILSITKKQASKVRRSKLYFLRKLSGKSARLKVKF
jgi:large subunit ribosomal protein L19